MTFATPEAAGARAGSRNASMADKILKTHVPVAGATVGTEWPLLQVG